MAALSRLSLVLALLSGPALAQDDVLDRFSGAYVDAPEITCTGAPGSPGGPVGLSRDVLRGRDYSCALSAPIDVRGMDAVLFDAACEGARAGRIGDRVMIMATRRGVALIGDGWVEEWTRCPG